MPHTWQLPPDAQTPSIPELSVVHEEPAATQRPSKLLPSVPQQAPVSVHLLLAQHGLPVIPQAAHLGFMSFARSHTAVPLHSTAPEQHGSPGLPQ